MPLGVFSQSEFCLNWFNATKINSSDKNCISTCLNHEKDVSESICGFDCSKFCKIQICKVDPYWKEKIKNGRPENWEIGSEKSVDWTEEEKDQVSQILDRLPDEFKNNPLKGIYRMKKSVDIINPGTTSEDGQSIVLYDRAFGHPMWTTEDVLLHELGHSIYVGYSDVNKQKYEKILGWKKNSQGIYSRSGSFVSARARDNPVEDFAENIKYLLLNSNKLKNENNQAFDWFSNQYKKQLKLKKECR